MIKDWREQKMKQVPAECKAVLERIKVAHQKLQDLVRSHSWTEEFFHYAEKQKDGLKKVVSADLKKVGLFLEKERKELEQFQKRFPNEIKKLRQFLKTQKKEFDHLIRYLKGLSGLKVSQTTSKTRSVKKPKPKVKKTVRSTPAKKTPPPAATPTT